MEMEMEFPCANFWLAIWVRISAHSLSTEAHHYQHTEAPAEVTFSRQKIGFNNPLRWSRTNGRRSENSQAAEGERKEGGGRAQLPHEWKSCCEGRHVPFPSPEQLQPLLRCPEKMSEVLSIWGILLNWLNAGLISAATLPFLALWPTSSHHLLLLSVFQHAEKHPTLMLFAFFT